MISAEEYDRNAARCRVRAQLPKDLLDRHIERPRIQGDHGRRTLFCQHKRSVSIVCLSDCVPLVGQRFGEELTEPGMCLDQENETRRRIVIGRCHPSPPVR